MHLKQKIVLLLVSLLPLIIHGQDKDFPKNYFTSPVDFKMALSGTFGELRTNHLHSGIDIKTYGATGKPLKAVADGFVSRVAVSPGGFGNAIYVEHPNGYTSVYAHCKTFDPEIADWVKKEQYRLEDFQVNLFPKKEQFKFKQGDIIAFSGNSGGSMGPHLHFEIRKTNHQTPVNPLLFNFDIKDFVRPTISGLKIFPANKYSFINGINKVTKLPLAGWGSEYHLKSGDTINLSGYFYFGISTFDKLNDANNQNGVYAIDFFIDTNLVYSHKMDQFDFSESRYVNSLIDYGGFVNEKARYQKTYIEPNNKLLIYQAIDGNGIFSFIDDEYHNLKYVVKDAGGNESILKLVVKSTPPQFKDVVAKKENETGKNIFTWREDNYFETSDFRLHVPKEALYDTMKFEYQVSDEIKTGFYAPVHKVHKPEKPLQGWCEISIKSNSFPERLKDKALIVGISENLIPAGGKWNGDFLTTKIRDFGEYSIGVDTVSPEIKPLNISDGKNISKQNSIKIKIGDDLSGIANYRATLNGEWLLMEWDPKNDLLVYWMDDRMKSGKNDFQLKVSDAVGNEANYEAILVR